MQSKLGGESVQEGRRGYDRDPVEKPLKDLTDPIAHKNPKMVDWYRDV